MAGNRYDVVLSSKTEDSRRVPGRVSETDPAGLKKLTDQLIKEMTKQSDSVSKGLIRAIEPLIKAVLRSQSPGQTSQNIDINRIVEQAVSAAVKNMMSSVSKSYRGGGSSDSTAGMERVLNRQIKNLSDSVTGALNSSLSRYNISLDPSSIRELQDRIEKSVSNIIPSTSITAIRDLGKSISSMKASFGELTNAIKSAKNIRTSGGGIDVNEIKPFFDSLKKVIAQQGQFKQEYANARKAVKDFASSAEEASKNLRESYEKALKSIQSSVASKVKTYREGAKEDPIQIARLIGKELANVVSKYPGMEGSKLDEAVKVFNDAGSSLEALTKTIKVLSDDLSKISKVSDKTAIPKEFSNLLKGFRDNLKSVPANITSDKGSAKWQEFAKTFNKITSAIDNLANKIDKIVAPTSSQQKVKVEQEVKITVDQKGFDKAGAVAGEAFGKAAEKSIKSGTKSVKLDVEKIYNNEVIGPLRSIVHQITKLGSEIDREGSSSLKKDFRSVRKSVSEGNMPTAVKDVTRLQSEASKIGNKALESRINKLADSISKAAEEFDKGSGLTGDAYSVLIDALAKRAEDAKGLPGLSKHDRMLKEVLTKVVNEYSGLSDAAKEIRKQSDVFLRNRNIEPAMAGNSGVPRGITSRDSSGMMTSFSSKVIDPTKPMKFDKTQKIAKERVEQLQKSLAKLQQNMIETLEKNLEDSFGKWQIVKDEGQTSKDASKIFKLAGGMDARSAGKQWSVQLASVSNLTDAIVRTRKELGSYVAGMEKELRELSAKTLLSKFEADIKNLSVQKVGPNAHSEMKRLISKWVEAVPTFEGIDYFEGSNKYLKKRFSEIKKKTASSPDLKIEDFINDLFDGISNSAVESMFKATYATAEAKKKIREGVSTVSSAGETIFKPLIRNIAIPAAKLDTQGNTVFETASGARRGLVQSGTFKSGFERLYDAIEEASLKAGKKLDYAGSFAEPIRSVGIRPVPGEIYKANELAKSMLDAFSKVGDVSQEPMLKSAVKEAALAKLLERKRFSGMSEDDFAVKAKRQIKMIEGFSVNEGGLLKNIDKVIAIFDKLGVSAYDVVKAMDQIEFENVYQLYEKILQGAPNMKQPLLDLAKRPDYNSTIRDFEKATKQVEQLMPVLPAGRVRRGEHTSNIINLTARTNSAIYTDKERLTYDDQKAIIRDLNLRGREMAEFVADLDNTFSEDLDKSFFKDIKADLRKRNIKTISSLGLPESQASSILSRGKTYDTEEYPQGTEYLQALRGETIKMYTDNIHKMAPFGMQAGNVGRAGISGIMNAVALDKDLGKSFEKFGRKLGEGLYTEFPGLRTDQEEKLIKGGRYGAHGFGFNVVTELRNTAGTHEDMVQISGKLAKALTSATKILTLPSSGGRLKGRVVGEDVHAVRPVEEKVLKDIGTKADAVMKQYMEILGVPKEYEGRADQALIDEVRKTVSVVRGEDVEVQAARLAEVFMNYFGRKFTTRHGSKGVGITASGGMRFDDKFKQLEESLSKGLDIKVLSESEQKKLQDAGLGIAYLPKTMGQLAAEIIETALGSNAEVELREKLIASGNKFIVDLFKDVNKGLIPDTKISRDKAEGLSKTFDKFVELLGPQGKAFEGKSDIESIGILKDLYKKTVSNPSLYERTPVDLRISAYGAGKRGLGSEVLEMVTSNIAGVKPGPPVGERGKDSGRYTVMKSDIGPSTYERLLGKAGEEGELSQYAKALGYDYSVSDNQAEIEKKLGVPEIKKKLEAEEKGSDKYKKLQSQLETALRAAALEKTSSYYVNMMDEFGKARKGLVSRSHFVEVVEEPGEFAEWSPTQVKELEKGIKLNQLAYQAYGTIFGEQSNFIQKEVKQGLSDSSRKNWEYIKTLQTLNTEQSSNVISYKDKLFKTLDTVKLSDLKAYENRTGRLDIPAEAPMSFKGTIMDMEKYPSAFLLDLPKTVVDPGEKLGEATEKFYVPGPMARQIYPEPLIAGEYGMDMVTRRLQTVVDRAKEFSRVKEDPYGALTNKEIEAVVRESILQKVTEARKIATRKPAGGERQLFAITDQLTNILSREPGQFVSKAFKSGMDIPMTEFDAARHFLQNRRDEPDKDVFTAYYEGIQFISDMLLGVSDETKKAVKAAEKGVELIDAGKTDDPLVQALMSGKPEGLIKDLGSQAKRFASEDIESLRSELSQYVTKQKGRAESMPGIRRRISMEKDPEERKQNIGILAERLGIKDRLEENALKGRAASLERAKIEYQKELTNRALGKSGAVEESMFTKRIPAAYAKAVAATVDRTQEIKAFSGSLQKIMSMSDQFSGAEKDFTKELVDIQKNIDDVYKSHKERVDIAKKSLKTPVLKQSEVGLPSELARLIPVEFEKLYKFNKKGELTGFVDRENRKQAGTLEELLKYMENIGKKEIRVADEASDEYPNIEGFMLSYEDRLKYIETKLLPYIETVRYPFTGTSSVVPYKAKLINSKQYKDMSKSSAMVPGAPEMDAETFKSLKDQIERAKVISSELKGVREKQLDLGKTPEDLSALSAKIEELDKAISEVTPKYMAHQQKLDFDGDSLFIHSAQLKESRSEIKKHYDLLSKNMSSSAKVFGDFYASEGIADYTGETPLASMHTAFEKKFPYEKGYEFLKKPFYSEVSSNIDIDKQFDILRDTFGSYTEAIKVILDDLGAGSEISGKITSRIEEMVRNDTANADSVLSEVESMTQGDDPKVKNINKYLKSAVRKRVSDEKYKSFIDAQLYKLHTGPEVESLARLQRAVESVVGFSGGLISPENFAPREDFAKRWPTDLEIFGEKGVGGGVGEFHTMLNEMSRFAQQAGMNVKHAGGSPITKRLVTMLSQGPEGVEKLWDLVENKDEEFGGLSDLNEVVNEAIKRRTGKMSTAEIRKELKQLLEARGAGADKMHTVEEGDRKQLIDAVTDAVGLKAFFEEIQRIIYEEAVKGLTYKLEQMTEKAYKGYLKYKNMSEFTGSRASAAKTIVESGKQGEGINISEAITKPLQPLYKYRTGTATPENLERAYREKYGEVQQRPIEVAGMDAGKVDALYKKDKSSQAVIRNLAKDLKQAEQFVSRGTYADQVFNSIEMIYKELDKLEGVLSGDMVSYKTDKDKELISSYLFQKNIMPEEEGDYNKAELTLGKLLSEEHNLSLPKVLKEALNKPANQMNKKVQEFSKLAGIPSMSSETEALFDDLDSVIAPMLEKEGYSGEALEKKTTSLVEKSKALYQMDNAIKAMRSRAGEIDAMKEFLPDLELLKTARKSTEKYKPLPEKGSVLESDAEDRARFFGPPEGSNVAPTREFTQGAEGITSRGYLSGECMPVTNCGGTPLDVRVVNIAEAGLGDAIEHASRVMTTEGRVRHGDLDVDMIRDRISDATNKLLGRDFGPGRPQGTAKEYYTASQLYPGGGYFNALRGVDDSTKQVKSIIASLVNYKEAVDKRQRLIMDIGTLIGAKLQTELEREMPGQVEAEKFVTYQTEKFGKISGYIDALIKKAPGDLKDAGFSNIDKVIDFKTVGESMYKELENLPDEIPFEDALANVSERGAKTLENARSQISAYLKGLQQMYNGTDEEMSKVIGEIRIVNRLNDREMKKVQFTFDPTVFDKDLQALSEARRVVDKYLSSVAAYGTEISDEDLQYKDIIDTLRKSVRSPGYKGKHTEEQGIASMEATAEKTRGVTMRQMEVLIEKAQKSLLGARPQDLESSSSTAYTSGVDTSMYERGAANRPRSSAYNDFERARRPQTETRGISPVFRALKSFHTEARIAQRMEGLNEDIDVPKFPQELQDMLEEAKIKGPDFGKFVDKVNELKDTKDIEGYQLNKAYKLYRLAVGDFYLKRAEEAKDYMDELSKDPQRRDEAREASAAFAGYVEKFQSFIRRGLGKPTDIYTKDRRYFTPQLAREADVYETPKRIMEKAIGPISDDDQLMESFSKIVGDLGKKGMKSPLEKTREVFKDLGVVNDEMVDLLRNSELMARQGVEIEDAWDLEGLVNKLSRLRNALEKYLKVQISDEFMVSFGSVGARACSDKKSNKVWARRD